MEKVINVLIFEEKDAVFLNLKRQCLDWAPNCLITRADRRKTLETRLKWMSYNLVLAGYGQPSFSAVDLLFYLKDVHEHCPLVFILDAARDYSSADTAIMKHAAACLYNVDFARKSFLMEEVIHKSLPKLNLRLAKEREVLKMVIRKEKAKNVGENSRSVSAFLGERNKPSADAAPQLSYHAGQHDAATSTPGHQDSDTARMGGEAPDCQSGGRVNQRRDDIIAP